VLAFAQSAQRQVLKGHPPAVLWFTGLSGTGKTTLAIALEQRLIRLGMHTMVLDGDSLRGGLNADLDFSAHSRSLAVTRTGQICQLLTDAGLIVIVALISPFARDRHAVRSSMHNVRFLEVYLDTPLSVCEYRDPKGLYQKARRGEIVEFTGIDSPYEPPASADLVLQTHVTPLDECVNQLITLLRLHTLLPPD
jgi:adenylylsulfate kinase